MNENDGLVLFYRCYLVGSLSFHCNELCHYTFTGIVFIFILLGIIGKFGLFPLNLGIFGIVDEGIRQLPRRDRLRRVSSYGTGIKR